VRRCCAEGVGTFILVLIGPGAAVLEAATGALTHASVSMAFGLAVFAMILTFGRISGAHINPAVTFGLALHGQFQRAEVLPYVAAQLTGAVVAAMVIRLAFAAQIAAAATVPAYGVPIGLAVEVLMSFVLMLVILRVASDAPLAAAAAVGGTIALEAFLGGPITGASMNPARTFGPAVASGVWTAHWLYWVAPLAGAMLASYSARAR
jgi:aquaporin Z